MGAIESDALRKEWLLITYRPVSLFSLRSTYATSKGGKTLLIPTPYAVKLALVDACFRAYSETNAESNAQKVLDFIQHREIRFLPPEHCVVQNTFVKTKQEQRDAPKGTYTATISYREFCFFEGDLTIALDVGGMDAESCAVIKHVARHVNYFGKRGSFFQYLKTADVEEIPPGYSLFDNADEFEFVTYSVMQALDDIGNGEYPDLFDRINSYKPEKRLSLGEHRVLKNTFLPYRMIRSTRLYTHYVRS